MEKCGYGSTGSYENQQFNTLLIIVKDSLLHINIGIYKNVSFPRHIEQRVKRPFLIKKNLDSLEINALTDNQSEMFIKSIHFDIISSVLKNGL